MFLVGQITYFDTFQMRAGAVAVPRSTKYCFLLNEGDKGGIILTVADDGNESN